MIYPKMLYRSDTQFADDESLKAGLAPGGAVRNRIVQSEEEEGEAVDAGWTDSPMDFIGTPDAPKRGRKAAAKAEEPAA
jgi:hypothetical protein